MASRNGCHIVIALVAERQRALLLPRMHLSGIVTWSTKPETSNTMNHLLVQNGAHALCVTHRSLNRMSVNFRVAQTTVFDILTVYDNFPIAPFSVVRSIQ